MALNLYHMSVPIYTRSLSCLLNVLKKGEKYADDNGVSHDKLIEARLAPDMNALAFQVQTATNTAKAVLPRLAGKEAPTFDDGETTFGQLYERIEKVLEALKTLTEEDFAGKESIEVTILNGTVKFTGLSYLQVFGLPNFFFHVTTAYGILRNQGVPVGKMDFIGSG